MPTCRYVLWPAIALGLGVSSLVQAQDDSIPGESYHWQVQVRGLYILPTNERQPGSVDLDSGFAGELAGEYLFMPRWSAELAVSTPANLDQRGAQGSLRLMTETLTAKYYFPQATVGGLAPYVGAGIYNASASRSGTAPNVGFSNPGVNVVLQAGFTYTIAENAFVSADIRYLNDLEPGLIVDGTNSGHLGVDPFVFGLGVGVRF
jgi:outer membrane protein W